MIERRSVIDKAVDGMTVEELRREVKKWYSYWHERFDVYLKAQEEHKKEIAFIRERRQCLP